MTNWISWIGTILMVCACTSCRGQDMIRIGFDVENGTPQYTLQSKAVTAERLVEVINKLGNLSDSQALVVVPAARVSASDLLGLLLTIKESRLHNIIISAPARRAGVDGRITMAMNLHSESFYGDVAPGYSGGFETNSSEFLDVIVKQDPDKKK